MIDSANCPLCCILMFPLQQVCVTRSVLSPRSVVKYCTCCSSCFPYISKKAQQGRAAFPEKAAAKVVLCCFPCSRLVWVLRLLYVVLVVLVVFPISARRRSKDGLLFLKKLPQKLFFVVSLAAGLSESQVVIRCTCCSSCFPYISKKTQYKVLTNRLTRD